MASRANFHLNVLLDGANGKVVAAGALDSGIGIVFRVNVFLHELIIYYILIFGNSQPRHSRVRSVKITGNYRGCTPVIYLVHLLKEYAIKTTTI